MRFSVHYISILTSHFQVSTTGIAIFYLFFLSKSSFYAVCLIKKQNLSMLYAILRNPNFTSALLIPTVLRMRFPVRCVMLPNTWSILERILALVRFPCFSHEVRERPLHPFLCRCARNLPFFRFASLSTELPFSRCSNSFLSQNEVPVSPGEFFEKLNLLLLLRFEKFAILR